jgi:hypothetical protein
MMGAQARLRWSAANLSSDTFSSVLVGVRRRINAA